MDNKDLDMEEVKILVLNFFEGNESKADLWLITPNPLLGGMTPNEYKDIKGPGKLLAWVELQLKENDPSPKT